MYPDIGQMYSTTQFSHNSLNEIYFDMMGLTQKAIIKSYRASVKIVKKLWNIK